MIKEAIQALVSGRSLTTEEATSVMEEIMQGEATPAQPHMLAPFPKLALCDLVNPVFVGHVNRPAICTVKFL